MLGEVKKIGKKSMLEGGSNFGKIVQFRENPCGGGSKHFWKKIHVGGGVNIFCFLPNGTALKTEKKLIVTFHWKSGGKFDRSDINLTIAIWIDR